MPTDKTRIRIAEAFIVLLAERDFAAIGLGDIAKAAEISLGTLRQSFDGRLAILAAFSRRIDEAMLAEGVSGEATPRERLFDVIMRRFDALRPHREGLKGLARSARRDPLLASALCRQAGNTARWILAAADVRTGALSGAVALNGVALTYATVFRVFLDDDDSGLARTMAALDRSLERGERAMGLVDRACSLLPRLAERGRAPREASPAG